MLPYLILAALIGALICLLYRQGFAVTKRISAVLFVFCPGKQADSISLNSCTGWVRHAGCFRQDWTYKFCLDCQLSAGSAEVALLDRQKRELLRLNQDNCAGEIELSGKARYCLRWEFKNATGTCKLHWRPGCPSSPKDKKQDRLPK